MPTGTSLAGFRTKAGTPAIWAALDVDHLHGAGIGTNRPPLELVAARWWL
jgi:hypothetical protein